MRLAFGLTFGGQFTLTSDGTGGRPRPLMKLGIFSAFSRHKSPDLSLQNTLNKGSLSKAEKGTSEKWKRVDDLGARLGALPFRLKKETMIFDRDKLG